MVADRFASDICLLCARRGHGKEGVYVLRAIEHTGTWSPHVAPMTILNTIINLYI